MSRNEPPAGSSMRLARYRPPPRRTTGAGRIRTGSEWSAECGVGDRWGRRVARAGTKEAPKKGRRRGEGSAEFDAGRARWWPNCANVIRLTGVVFAPSRAGFATAHRDAISAIGEKSGGAREAWGFDVPTAFGGVRAAGIIGESGISRGSEGLTCGNVGHRLRRWNDSARSSGAAVMRG